MKDPSKLQVARRCNIRSIPIPLNCDLSQVSAYLFVLGTTEVWVGEIPLDREADQFPLFEVVVKKRGRTWRWRVCTTAGDVVMQGSESIRTAAKYKADRALFLLLLSAPYRSMRMSNPESAGSSRSGRNRSAACPQANPRPSWDQAGSAKSR